MRRARIAQYHAIHFHNVENVQALVGSYYKQQTLLQAKPSLTRPFDQSNIYANQG